MNPLQVIVLYVYSILYINHSIIITVFCRGGAVLNFFISIGQFIVLHLVFMFLNGYLWSTFYKNNYSIHQHFMTYTVVFPFSVEGSAIPELDENYLHTGKFHTVNALKFYSTTGKNTVLKNKFKKN